MRLAVLLAAFVRSATSTEAESCAAADVVRDCREAGRSMLQTRSGPFTTRITSNRSSKTQRNREICPEMAGDEVFAYSAAALGLDLTRLPADAKLRVCEMRQPDRGGVLYIEDLLSLAELPAIRTAIESMQTDSFSTAYIRHSFNWSDHILEDLIQGLVTLPADSKDVLTYLPGFRMQDSRVHHDRNWDMQRAVTVLIYINAPSEGGHTVFPWTALPGAEGRLHPAAEEAASVFPSLGERSPEEHRLSYASGPVAEVARAACEDLRRSDKLDRAYTNFFGFKPIPGDAVVFWHYAVNTTNSSSIGPPEWNHFHAGCSVFGNEPKIALQYFANRGKYS